ncbi:MAG: cytochrome c-type biogenesis protein CcmH [Wenzhouxiangellaceae bacterium]
MKRPIRDRWRIGLVGWLLALCCQYALAVDPLQFASEAEAQRHQQLSAELRCLVCQNQSLADSDAPLAQDLRREVLDLMRQGLNDQQIRDHLVARYSDFVLYRPPLNAATILLWFGPLLLLLLALALLYRAIRRQQQVTDGITDPDE